MPAAHPSFLRYVLYLDAATCIACGALMSFAAAPLSEATEIPSALLRYAGASLFPIAAFMALVGKRAPDATPAIWCIACGNSLWVLASLWLLWGGAITPNALGSAFIAVQAAGVAVLTALEIRGALALARRRSLGSMSA